MLKNSEVTEEYWKTLIKKINICIRPYLVKIT